MHEEESATVAVAVAVAVAVVEVWTPAAEEGFVAGDVVGNGWPDRNFPSRVFCTVRRASISGTPRPMSCPREGKPTPPRPQRKHHSL